MTQYPKRAQELKKIFGVYGHFYTLSIAGEDYPCRSVLELIEHEQTPKEINQIQSRLPDLMVIMMNPGSSRPLDQSYTPPLITDLKMLQQKNYVPTRPDTTQYQIMRVMVRRGYKHARIFNLSDLREPKSTIFLKKIAKLGYSIGGEVHSLFCKERTKERMTVMGCDKKRPIIAGWGRNKGLLPLATRCLTQIQAWPVVGVSVNEEQTLFAHPSPMLQKLKDNWITAILQQLP
ncbi:hypothetical protein ACQZV8_12580 [Magnetococcales bacterium HHB-1]